MVALYMHQELGLQIAPEQIATEVVSPASSVRSPRGARRSRIQATACPPPRGAGMRLIAMPNRGFPPSARALGLADVVIHSLDQLRPELLGRIDPES
ncbi:MAG: hypothetical protein M3Z95_04485 [Actinomycetota bacterium]|nr:hypothetical protein [Actinomycetota bacterium]